MTQAPPPLPATAAAAAAHDDPYAPEPEVWRDGKLIVALDGACLPTEQCLRCGGKPQLKKDRKFSWHNPVIAVTILAGLLPYAVLALALTKRATVTYALCKSCRGKARMRTAIYWLLALGSLASLILGIILIDDADLGGALMAIGALGLLITGILAAVVPPNPIRPKKIDDGQVWIKGVTKNFARDLPKY